MRSKRIPDDDAEWWLSFIFWALFGAVCYLTIYAFMG